MKTLTFVTWVNVSVPDEVVVDVKHLYFNHLISDKVEVWNGKEILPEAYVLGYSTEDVMDDVNLEEDNEDEEEDY